MHFPRSFSYRSCPIRPFGAPSPRGEGFVSWISLSPHLLLDRKQKRFLAFARNDDTGECAILPSFEEGRSVHASPFPWKGRGAQRGGVGFLFATKPPHLCLPHRGRGTAPAVDRVLSLMAYLRRSSPLFFIPLLPYPPLRGTFFHRKEDVSTRAPSLGRGEGRSEAGLASFFAAEPPPLCLPHRGRLLS